MYVGKGGRQGWMSGWCDGMWAGMGANLSDEWRPKAANEADVQQGGHAGGQPRQEEGLPGRHLAPVHPVRQGARVRQQRRAGRPAVGLDCLEQRRAWRDRASALAAAPMGPAQHLLERRVCQRVALLPQLLQLAWPLVRLAPDQLVALAIRGWGEGEAGEGAGIELTSAGAGRRARESLCPLDTCYSAKLGRSGLAC